MVNFVIYMKILTEGFAEKYGLKRRVLFPEVVCHQICTMCKGTSPPIIMLDTWCMNFSSCAVCYS